MRVAELEYQQCPECGIKYSEEDTDYCPRCKQLICPKCSACGCVPRDKLYLQPRFA